MQSFFVIFLSLALISCGGGEISSAASNSQVTKTLTVTGTAATGLAIPSGTIAGRCKAGTGVAITEADGTFILRIPDGQMPCILQITNPADGVKLHTVVAGGGDSGIANITPITELATGRLLGIEPSNFFATFDPEIATHKITSTSIQTAQSEISDILTDIVDVTALSNFFYSSLKAATQSNPTNGDLHDKVLDALKRKLTNTQITTLTSLLASNQSTSVIRQSIAKMTTGNFSESAVPIANAGATQNVTTGTIVTLDASNSSAASGRSLVYIWTLISKPTSSRTILGDPRNVRSTFLVDVAGTYVASLVVSDGTATSSVATVTINAAAGNIAPVANAGVTQQVLVGGIARLDGTASTDANGDNLSFVWTLTSRPPGSNATLTNPKTSNPTFLADVAGSYVAALIVSDGTANSNPVAVTVIAQEGNVAPVANAGVDQKVLVGSVVQLNGSASYDANADPLTYAWKLISVPSGSFAKLSSTTSQNPSFSADLEGSYVVQLIVNDGKFDSGASSIVVLAAPGITINSGNNQTISQHLSLDRPLQAAITDASGNRVSNIPVTFFAKDGAGRYTIDETVRTDHLGFATWMPNYFHKIGTQTISAAASGYGTATFTIFVVATSHSFDGYFKCDVGASVTIINGKIVASDQWVFNGVLNESDGSISGVSGNDAQRFHYTGKILTSPLSPARISGVYYTTSIAVAGGKHVTDGVWSCIRQ